MAKRYNLFIQSQRPPNGVTRRGCLAYLVAYLLYTVAFKLYILVLPCKITVLTAAEDSHLWLFCQVPHI